MSLVKTFASLALAAVAVAPQIAEAGVVVASSGPSARTYPIGAKLPNGTRIQLQAGDSLTVLDGASTRVLRGAGTFTVGGRVSGTRRTAFNVLTEERSATRMRTGAVRSTGSDGKVRPPNLWYVDVDSGGTTCLPKSTAIRLWRAMPKVKASYAVSTVGASGAFPIEFAAGEALAGWDSAAAPLTPGAEYRIAGAAGASPAQVKFEWLDTIPSDPEVLATQLMERGCSAQVELLVDTLRISG